MTDETVTDTGFDAIPIDDLPTSPKGADPASIALGTAVLSVLSPTVAANDRLTYADRKDAVNRAAVIKRGIRAANATPAGFRTATRIIAGESGYRVVILLATDAPKAPKGGKAK